MRNRLWAVRDIQPMTCRGPWDTKSGGKLNVMFSMPLGDLQDVYLDYNEEEIDKVPDIRGLRVYTVRQLPKGRIGGTEFHKIREEIVFAIEGCVLWTCEDIFGQKRDFMLNSQVGVWMPPYILHTYEAREEGSGLLVMANTLFNPDDPSTHNTYSVEKFRELQAPHKSNSP